LTSILILDDDIERHNAIDKAIGPGAFHAYSAERAIDLLNAEPRFDLVLLDHDLGSFISNGQTVAAHIESMSEDKRPARALIHSWNRDGAQRMSDHLTRANVWHRYRPFGTTMLSMAKTLVEMCEAERFNAAERVSAGG
jgi:CheY-like chemotaxis protein